MGCEDHLYITWTNHSILGFLQTTVIKTKTGKYRVSGNCIGPSFYSYVVKCLQIIVFYH